MDREHADDDSALATLAHGVAEGVRLGMSLSEVEAVTGPIRRWTRWSENRRVGRVGNLDVGFVGTQVEYLHIECHSSAGDETFRIDMRALCGRSIDDIVNLLAALDSIPHTVVRDACGVRVELTSTRVVIHFDSSGRVDAIDVGPASI